MNDISRVAFTVFVNWQFMSIVIGLILGIIVYIVMSGTTYDRVLTKIKNFPIKLSMVVGAGCLVLGLLIAIILWACRVNVLLFAPIDIYWYAIMIVTGMLVAIVSAMLMAKKKGFSYGLIIDLALVVIPLGIIGARLWFVMFPYENGSHNINTFWEFFDLRTGGLGIYGGIIFGALGVVIVSFWKKINILKLLDVVAPSVMIAQAIGRWGNFFNQEAFGTLVTNPALQWFPLSVHLKNGEWHLATFFYEFLWNTVGFIFIYWYCYNRNKIDSIGVCSYFLWYGIGRSWIECLRTDALFVPGTNIRVSVLFSIIMIVISLGVGFWAIYHYKKTGLQLFEKPKAAVVGADSSEETESEQQQETTDDNNKSGD